jgi:hypothetical protein
MPQMPRRGQPFSGGKILLYGTAQVTPASKEGKSKKAKGKREEMPRAARLSQFAKLVCGSFLLLPFAFLLLPLEWSRSCEISNLRAARV